LSVDISPRIAWPGAITLAAVMVALASMVAATPAEAAPLSCSGTATNAVGAHAGSLSTRVGLDIQCDESAHLEVTLPGGWTQEFDTDASGAFFGVAGDAYVCSGNPQPVAVYATGASGTWTGLLSIDPEQGAPANPDGPGPVCDVLLHPSFNYVSYSGAIATPVDALADGQFNGVLPFEGSSSMNGSDHVLAVFELVPVSVPGTWEYHQWRPGAPDFVNTLHFLAPGHTYIVLTDAELAWTFPAAP
jgi:hypothetical protein